MNDVRACHELQRKYFDPSLSTLLADPDTAAQLTQDIVEANRKLYKARRDVMVDCFNRGLYLRMSGDSFALSPPLIVEKSHIDDIVSILGDARLVIEDLVPQVELAERLLSLAGAPTGSRVFFCNSGAEALEAGIKLARRRGGGAARPRRHRRSSGRAHTQGG